MNILNEEKVFLLKLARSVINNRLNNNNLIFEKDDKFPILDEKTGAFVTLHKKTRLRGCIGYIIGFQPLYNTIIDAANQAAFSDPRFSPLKIDEFDEINLEISVLSPPFPLKNYSEIIVGEHGLILSEKGRRALLLPQVPIEHNLNKDEYLSALCEKGGFHPNLWKEKQLSLEAFTAIVFSEKEMGIRK
jgi:AmmeMemoRadiSam system protein A